MRRQVNAGAVKDVLGMTHVVKVETAETNGAFMAHELTVPPGHGAPMHRHVADTEWFFVLSGAVTFVAPEFTRIARPGDACLAPAGGAHAFRNDTDQPARVLVVTTPGLDAEAFFDEVDATARRGPIDGPAVAAIAARHNVAIRPPMTRS